MLIWNTISPIEVSQRFCCVSLYCVNKKIQFLDSVYMADTSLAYLTACTLLFTANRALILYNWGRSRVKGFTLSYSENRFSCSPRGWIICSKQPKGILCLFANDGFKGRKWKSFSRTLCNPMDYTVHGILQARILEWVVFPFSRGSSQPRNQTPCHFCQNNKGKFAETETLKYFLFR